jgi:hypothetical protein
MSDDLRYSLGLDGSKFDGVVNRSVSGIQGLGGALAALGATGAFAALIKRGFEFNKTMGDSEAAIAQVLAQFKGLDAQASKQEAAAAMQQLIDLEPKAAGSLRDLTGGFLATLAASQSAGLSVQQNIDLVGRFANAMANAAIPTDQLAQEMRSIITANIGADSSLARILGITNEMVSQARDAGQLYDFLATRIGKLGEAGDTAAVAFSSLESAIDKAAGALAKGLFVQALDGSKNLTDAINDNTAAFEDLGKALASITTFAINAFQGVNQVMRGIGATAAVVTDVLQNGASWSDAWKNAQAALNKEFDATAQKGAAAAKATTSATPTSEAGTPARSGSSSAAGRSAKAMEEARNQLLLEVAIADATAKGQDRKAADLRRELDIRRDTLRIIEQTGASEEQARKAAERLNPAGGSTRADGRRRIQGVQASQLMGSAGGGGLDQLSRLQQKREVSTAEMARTRATRGGGRGLPIGQGDGFVPAFPAFPQAAKQAGNALSSPKPEATKDSAAGGSTLSVLKSIDDTLKTLKAA